MDTLLGRGLSFQAGLDLGYGQTVDPSASGPSNGTQQQSTSSDVLRAYALARTPLVGIEAGFMKLPEMKTKFYTPDYPAYKKAAQGLDVTYPKTALATQDITSSSPYVRANVYGPSISGVEPYGFFGKARVRTDNHENALYNGTDVNDYRETLKKTANYFGVGFETEILKNVNLRAEYGRIPKAVDEYHTGTRDISMGTIGLGVKW